jgi:tetratricopeptide (TPR) repeat protein
MFSLQFDYICLMSLRSTLLLLFTVSYSYSQNPGTLDSLSRVWNDTRQPDTVRLASLDALYSLFARSNPDSARAYADKQRDFAHGRGLESWEARADDNIADLYYKKGNHALAISYYQKSILIYSRLKLEAKRAESLHRLGIVEYYNGTYDEAMKYDLQALLCFEKLGDQDGIADIHHDIGKIYYRRKEYPEALKHYQASLTVYQKLGDKHGAASSLNNMAGVYGDQQNYTKMLEYLLPSLRLVEELGEQNGIATRVHNIGFVYQKLGDFELAMNYFERGLRIREEMMDQKGIAYSLNSIGQVLSEKGDQEKALSYLKRSLKVAEETGVREAIKSGYEELSKVYYKMHLYQEAFDNHLRCSEIKDSIFTEESSHQIAEMQTKFETEKKEKELQLQKAQLVGQDAELKRQGLEKLALFIGLALLILLAFVLTRSNKNMKKANEIISKQKKMVEEQKAIVEIQKEVVEEKNKNITDSINYARLIQQSQMPTEKYFNASLKRLQQKQPVNK